MRLFPDDHDGEALIRTQRVWDLSGPLPLPRYELRCPSCAIGHLAVKDWKFHSRSNVGSKHPWRCDTRLKCMTCGCVHIFGVVVPEEMFTAMSKRLVTKSTSWIHWRAGRIIIEEGS
jgi:hypothetical protein